MSTLPTRSTLHPILWVAAISVTLFAVAGIGAITGVIPTAKSQTEPQPVAQPVAATPAPVAAVTQPAPGVVTKKSSEPARHHRMIVARNDPPPPTGAVPPDYAAQTPAPAASIAAVCNDCGRVESIQRIMQDGQGSGVGAVTGGALGGLLGNGVGQGNGRTIATIAGVIGGAMLGNHVEKSNKQSTTYKTTVRFEDGTSRVITTPGDPGLIEGQRVRMVNGAIQPI